MIGYTCYPTSNTVSIIFALTVCIHEYKLKFSAQCKGSCTLSSEGKRVARVLDRYDGDIRCKSILFCNHVS